MVQKIRSTVIVVLIFLGSYFFYANLVDNGFGLLNFIQTGKNSELYIPMNNELLSGDIVQGKIRSLHPNLGIISVRFDNRYRDSRDTLLFRIKEAGATEWYYEAEYNTDQFQPHQLFPFGFPKINDSTGKNYIFEIESLRGATGSSIFVDTKPPTYLGVEFVDKELLISSQKSIFKFILQKIINLLSNRNNLTSAFIYFSPLIFFLIYKSSYQSSFHLLTSVTLLSISWDIVFLTYHSDFFVLTVITLWLLTTCRYRFKSQVSAFLAIIFFLTTSLLMLLGKTDESSKSAVWSYLFTFFSLCHQFYERRFKPTRLVGLKHLYSHISQIKYGKSNYIPDVIKWFVGPVSMIYSLFLCFNKVLYSIGLFADYSPQHIWSGGFIFYLLVILALFLTHAAVFSKGKVSLIILSVSLYISTSVLSANLTTFQFRPKILSVSPQTTSEAWADITVTGRNFQDMPFVGVVTIDGVEQGEYLISWSDHQIVFRTNPIITKSGKLCVNTTSKGTSNCVDFVYKFGMKTK